MLELYKSLSPRITIDPLICHGKPCVRGLRYSVESLLEYLVSGDSMEDILSEFPDLERKWPNLDISALSINLTA